MDGSGGGLAEAEQLHGKEMSYNNYTDTDAARRAAYDHAEPCVAIIKHANPCGIAIGADVAEAHRKAHACDPLSAFGGVIAVNRPVSKEMAEQVAEIFTEVIVAPDYEEGALEVLTKKKNIRVLRAPDGPENPAEIKQIDGGALLQVTDRLQAEGDDPAHWTLASGDALGPDELRELAFAWKACRAVKSNAILLAKDGASVGVGMGQVNRVDSCKLAVERRAGGAGPGFLRRFGRLLPVPRRAGDPDRRGCQGHCPAGWFDPRRTGRGGRPGGGRDHVLHGDAPLLPLSRSPKRPAALDEGAAGLSVQPQLTASGSRSRSTPCRERLLLGVPQRPQPAEVAGHAVEEVGDTADEGHADTERLTGGLLHEADADGLLADGLAGAALHISCQIARPMTMR